MQAKLPTHLLGTFGANRDRALHAALARTHGPPLAADTRRLRFATTQRTLEHRQYHGLQYEEGYQALNTVYLYVPLLPLHPTFMPRLLHWLEHWLGLRLVHGEITVPPTASTHLDEASQLREAVLFMETLPGPLIEKAFRAMMGKNQGRTFTPLLQAAFADAADPGQPRLWERIHAGMRDQAEQQRRLAEEAAGAAPPLHQLQPAAAAAVEAVATAASEEEEVAAAAAEEEEDEMAVAEDGVAAAADVWQVQEGYEWMEGAASDDDVEGPASFQGLGGAATPKHDERASSLDLSPSSPPNFPPALAATPALPHRTGLSCGGPYGATPHAVLTAEQDRLYRQLRREALVAALKAHEARLEAQGADFLSARLLAVHSVQCVRAELEARALQAAMSVEGGGAASWATNCAAAGASTGAGLLSALFHASHAPFGGALGGQGWVPQHPNLLPPAQRAPRPLVGGGIHSGGSDNLPPLDSPVLPTPSIAAGPPCTAGQSPPSANFLPPAEANQGGKRGANDQRGRDGHGGGVQKRRRRQQRAESPSALGLAGGAGSVAGMHPEQALFADGPPAAAVPPFQQQAGEAMDNTGRPSPLLLDGDAVEPPGNTALGVQDPAGPGAPAAHNTFGDDPLNDPFGLPPVIALPHQHQQGHPLSSSPPDPNGNLDSLDLLLHSDSGPSSDTEWGTLFPGLEQPGEEQDLLSPEDLRLLAGWQADSC